MSPVPLFQRGAELARLLDEVADVDWRACLARAGARAAADGARAIAIARARRGEPSLPPAELHAAAIAVVIGDEAIATARHAHRRAWSSRGGPWLGVAHAPRDGREGMTIVSTCHMIVDGYGHAWIASRIAAAIARARDTVAILARAA